MLNKSSKYCLLAVVASGLLAGCESKSVTTAVSNALDNLDIEVKFDEEEELALVRVDSDNEVILRYGSGENNKIQRALVIVADDNIAVKDDVNDYGTFLKTHVKVTEDLAANLYSFRDDAFPRRYIEFITLEDGNILLEVRGEKPIDIPKGEHRYRYVGTNIMAVKGNRAENQWGSGSAHGEFSMDVNFENKTGTIEGNTARRNAVGSNTGLDGSRIAGNFTVDVEKGTFFLGENDNITVTNASAISEDSLTYSAHIFGNFHGKGANGVTGLYVEKRDKENEEEGGDLTPRFYGAISGVRGDQSTTLKEVRKFDNDLNKVFTVVRVKAGGEHILRYGRKASNNPRRGIVIDYLGVEQDKSIEHGNFHKGRAYVGLEGYGEFNRFVDSDMEELYVDIVRIPDAGRILFEVGGGSEFTIPTGMHTYTGTNVFAVRGTRTENSWGTGYFNGTFTMDANFVMRTASIMADTPRRPSGGDDEGMDPMSLSGSVHLNTEEGTFFGDDMVVTNSGTNQQFDAYINGSFHGDNANGVTGLYVEQHDNPRFFGAVVGVREDVRNQTN